MLTLSMRYPHHTFLLGMNEHVEALVCLSALSYGSYIKEMLHFGNLYRLANFHVNKKLNGRGDLCRNEECQMNEWGYSPSGC